jgi:hypothetical protein
MIEKGLITEYRKIHKNLSEEVGLQPVAWYKLREFMVQKYEHFEFLVAKCYPNQSLAFNAQALRECFDLAEQKYKKTGGEFTDTGGISDSDDISSITEAQ